TVASVSQPVALHTSAPTIYNPGPYGYYAPSMAQPIGVTPGFSYLMAQITFPAQQLYYPAQQAHAVSPTPSCQANNLPHAFTTETLQDLANGAYNFNTGGEVLRRLVSSNFISCNKEKPHVLCHACQLGKNVRLPFVSSDIVINSCFDIIHSDVWTSPILSLSSFKYYLFRHKYLVDGTLSRYKARLVTNGSTQLEGVDVDETFSPVVKPGTIRTVLSLAASRHWTIHQLDVMNAFLHGDLSETLYASKKYVLEILDRAHMANCNPSQTPIDTESKLGSDGDPVSDPTLYRSLAALKRILRYVRGTLDYGLQLFSSFTTELVAYLDADWAGCPTTRRSTSGYCVFLGNNLLSWSSKRHPVLSRSSAEAKYHGFAIGVAETCWLRNLLRELHTPLSSATLVNCDNFTDIFTKGLSSALFEEFRSSLSIRCPPAPTAGEC
ncbi:ribonuclease H-like domain-containing protein, partial [Tanacetum coccineum]